jgi:hypothetical protein
MKRLLLLAAIALLPFGCAPAVPLPPEQPVAVDQGPYWSGFSRAAYYTVDQGSRLMPLGWFRALKRPDGTAFLSGRLARYGYLRNYEAPASDLPVGFTTNGPANDKWIGMNCAACHTRQIDVGTVSYRIDGGPAIADFQAFLADLDTAVAHLLADPPTFKTFAADVLGGHPSDGDVAKLRAAVQAWFVPYDLLIQRALPSAKPWGPARLDAVGMIFDRLTGLDIGSTPGHTIPANIKQADSPVRYPFLWNASRQDFTQWPGFAANGDTLLGLARNTGEVIGVFAQFHPSKDAIKYPHMKVDYTSVNSSDTLGLLALEQLITLLGPPKFQWPTDPALVKEGADIFNLPTEKGGCVECHGEQPGAFRGPVPTWKTPILDVGTDNREWTMLGVPGDPAWPGWQVDTGVLSGAEIPFITDKLKPVDSAFSVLGTSVIGTILQRIVNLGDNMAQPNAADTGPGSDLLTAGVHAHSSRSQELKLAFVNPDKLAVGEPPFKYESRVLHGIWATAPYLHNGSVPTLADLLKPAADRPASFKVGPAYDPVNVGLATDQTAFNYTLKTTGCDQRTSGDSNCGHEFGTKTLTPEQKKALLEYLKTL